jgi:hypothetical protein
MESKDQFAGLRESEQTTVRETLLQRYSLGPSNGCQYTDVANLEKCIR